MTFRVGSRMLAVLRYVAAHPGCSKGQAAEAAVPSNRRAGYETVGRCISAGLLTMSPEHGPPPAAGYTLHITTLGTSVIDQTGGGD